MRHPVKGWMLIRRNDKSLEFVYQDREEASSFMHEYNKDLAPQNRIRMEEILIFLGDRRKGERRK